MFHPTSIQSFFINIKINNNKKDLFEKLFPLNLLFITIAHLNSFNAIDVESVQNWIDAMTQCDASETHDKECIHHIDSIEFLFNGRCHGETVSY